jgi:hypothetical protein
VSAHAPKYLKNREKAAKTKQVWTVMCKMLPKILKYPQIYPQKWQKFLTKKKHQKFSDFIKPGI